MATIDDQIKDLEELVQRLTDDKLIQDRVTTVAALETFAQYKDRIFADGKATNGSRIGDYDTKPYYVGKSQLKGLPKSKFKPKGKDGKSKFKSGKSKKTTYVKQGYFQFRKLAGRQNKTVDLNLTGASARSIQLGTKGDLIIFGFTDESRRQILIGNERKYRKDIFTVSQAELETFQEAAARELRFIIRQAV
jgi:hypothetical protein